MNQIAADFDVTPIDFVPQRPTTRRFRTFRVVTALILRETGSRETRSSLGFLWNMIDPIASVFILTMAFSLVTKHPPLGTNFPLFYVTGILPLTLYTQVQAKVASSIRFSKSLLGFPAVTALDALFARFLLNVFTSVVIFVALTSSIVAYYDIRVNVDVAAVVMSIAMASALALGIGTLNSVLFLASPTYESVFGIITKPQMLISGVFFLVNTLPANIFYYLKWNPLAQIIAEMRGGFYPTYDISWVSPAYIFLIAGICFTLGLIGIKSYVFDALEK